ncbi:hypothetical protein V2595_15190 [Tenacibaculum maritimum]|uniref:hypothetical protein n=1 Tax=Tenacibaculum maritimum TaxID=107401 RepID=UPI0012E49C7F|nr:hypothetical protein [Tenacibaculum maritimum]CAA0227777.1 conserved hypothetical protein [Tenacibaculum maritimum]
MQVKKDLVVYLPKLLIDSLEEELKRTPPSFNYKLDYFIILFNYIQNLEIRRKKREFQALNKQKLKTITTSNIERYITYLKNGEFLICDNSYQKNVKSYHYRLNDSFYSDEIKEYIIPANSKQASKILKVNKNEKAHYNRMPDYLRSMQKKFNCLEFNYENANDWVESNSSGKAKIIHLTSLKNIKDKRLRYFKRNRTNNRLDTNLTNLKSELRQFMVGNFIYIDLKNSQPVLLGAFIFNLINNSITSSPSPSSSDLCPYLTERKMAETFGKRALNEVLKIHQKHLNDNSVNFLHYYNSVKTGRFYEEFMKIYSTPDKKKLKKMMFAVFYSNNWKRYKSGKIEQPHLEEKEIFSTVYPFLCKAIYTLKKKNYKNLSIYLQQFESYIFIDCISKKLVENGIIPYTIHDAVIIEKEHQQKALEIMKEVFLKKVGILPTFEIEDL